MGRWSRGWVDIQPWWLRYVWRRGTHAVQRAKTRRNEGPRQERVVGGIRVVVLQIAGDCQRSRFGESRRRRIRVAGCAAAGRTECGDDVCVLAADVRVIAGVESPCERRGK